MAKDVYNNGSILGARRQATKAATEKAETATAAATEATGKANTAADAANKAASSVYTDRDFLLLRNDDGTLTLTFDKQA